MNDSEACYIKNTINRKKNILEKLLTFKELNNMVFMTDEGNEQIKNSEKELITSIEKLKNDTTAITSLILRLMLQIVMSIVGIIITFFVFFVFPKVIALIIGIITLRSIGVAMEIKEEIDCIKNNRNIEEKVYELVDIIDNHIVFKN